MVLDARYPFIPGNVANASTFDFPVRYQRIEGGSIERLLYQRDSELAAPFIEAARQLERDGVQAITGACGFMALFQQQVRDSVSVPVLLTSLLQIPFIKSITNRPVGVITADASSLGAMNLEGIGIHPSDMRMVGMEHCPAFSSAILSESGRLDSPRIREEVVEQARLLLQKHPEIGAILLECSDLPPYARAIQHAVGLPVFDYTSMIRHVATSLRPHHYDYL